MFIPHETFGVNLVRNTPDGELHAGRNYKLCRAVDMIGLAVVLNEMVKTGHISHRQAKAFEAQAGGLLATMLTENDRSFIGSPEQSTAEKIRRFGIEAAPREVYWSREAGNFYDEQTNTGMGVAFYEQWRRRKDEFPEKATSSVSMDIRRDKKV